MGTNSIIEHRANYYYLKLREEYLILCQGNHCQALILDALEEWTNSKREKKQSLYVYMTYPQWVTALYGMYGRSTIIDALNTLEEAHFISKRPYRIYGKDTFEYLLNEESINAAIRELPAKSPEETLPKLDAFKNRRVQNQTRLNSDGKTSSRVQNQTRDASKNRRNIELLSQNSNNTELNNDVAVATDTSDDLSSSHEEKPEAEAPQKKTEKPTRKPKAPKKEIDPEMQARINAVFDCLDKLGQETSESSDFTYSRTKKAKEDISELLDGRVVSPTNLRLVYMEMWNAPKGKDGFSWKENMSIAAICRHYDQKLLAAMSKQKKTPAQNTQNRPPEAASTPRLPKEAATPYVPQMAPSRRDRRGLTPTAKLRLAQEAEATRREQALIDGQQQKGVAR
jgi:hypothetical protein